MDPLSRLPLSKKELSHGWAFLKSYGIRQWEDRPKITLKNFLKQLREFWSNWLFSKPNIFKVKIYFRALFNRHDPTFLPDFPTLQGCYGSAASAFASIFSMTAAVKDMDRQYPCLASLLWDIKNSYYNGDTVVIAMSHPLHFAASPFHLVFFYQICSLKRLLTIFLFMILQLHFLVSMEKLNLPLNKIFFLVLGFEARGSLRISPALICAQDLKDMILQRPKLHPYGSPCLQYLYACKDGILIFFSFDIP